MMRRSSLITFAQHWATLHSVFVVVVASHSVLRLDFAVLLGRGRERERDEFAHSMRSFLFIFRFISIFSFFLLLLFFGSGCIVCVLTLVISVDLPPPPPPRPQNTNYRITGVKRWKKREDESHSYVYAHTGKIIFDIVVRRRRVAA